MYETGNEFKIILTDYNCPHKQNGRCKHTGNITDEHGVGFKWCDEKICPLKIGD